MHWLQPILVIVLLLSCGQDSRIRIPEVEGFEAPADDTDLLPIRDRAYYRRTLPADGRCRVRYTADFAFDVYAGNLPISERDSPTALYAAQYATRYASMGICRPQAEDCRIVPLRRGWVITIEGERLGRNGIADWNELARLVNALYRHQLCGPM